MTRPGLPTRGHHVFVAPFGDADRVVVDGDEGHHLAGVLRVRAGQPLSLADNTGAVFAAEVEAVDRRSVTVRIGQRYHLARPAPSLCVVQSLPKGKKMEEVVQRLTEVGVDRIRPVVSDRTVKRPDGKADRLQERWEAIARSAAQQSRRPRLPVIAPIGVWPVEGAVGVVLWEEATTSLSEAVRALPDAEEIVVAVGPEGGFGPSEVQASGLTPCALGSTILRTETAGVVGASLVAHLLGRMG